MQSLPDSVTAYKRTPIFSEISIPRGLLNEHRTKAGVWGQIVVVSGELLYRILEPVKQEERLSNAQIGVVAPQQLHQVEALGDVRFYVEFYH